MMALPFGCGLTNSKIKLKVLFLLFCNIDFIRQSVKNKGLPVELFCPFGD